MVNTTFQHHPPFVLPINLTLKLAALHRLLLLHHWQRSLPLFPTLSNECIALRHKTQHLWNIHTRCLNITYTVISPNSLFGLRYQHQVIELGRPQTVRILLPYWFTWVNKKVSLAWCHIWDVRSSVQYCTEVDLQSSNKKVLLLTRCQQIYAL